MNALPTLRWTTIAVALFKAVEELDFAGPWEVLSVWAKGWPGDGVDVLPVADSNEPVNAPRVCASWPTGPWRELRDRLRVGVALAGLGARLALVR
jgi:hypothetical protein